MTPERFQGVVDRRLKAIKLVLEQKNKEQYATVKDALHNFHAAAKRRGVSPAEALQGMVVKHEIALDDMIRRRAPVSHKRVDEVLGDIIVYAILQEGNLTESLDNHGGVPHYYQQL